MANKKKKQKQTTPVIDNQFKTNGTRTDLDLQLVNEDQLLKEVQEQDKVNWGLTNLTMATQFMVENALDTILGNFRKYGYNGDHIERVASAMRKVKFANNNLNEAIKPCYKDNLIQPITIGNLMSVIEDIVSTAIGLTMDGKYCSSEFELAFVPKTLKPAIQLAPGMSGIEWVNDTIEKVCREGYEYLDKHDLNGNDVEFRVGKHIKAQRVKK